MADSPRFEPIYPAHAIERCAVAFVFNEAIPEKLFAKVRNRADSILEKIQLLPQPQTGISIQIDPQRGLVTPRQVAGGPVQYINGDRTLNVAVNSNSLIWVSHAYVRWQPFVGQIEQFILPLLTMFEEAVSLVNIQLDYLDRFFWTGSWENFSTDTLLKSDSDLLSKQTLKAAREWHSHIGWFDNITSASRRLTQVNIDVVGAARPGSTDISPSVGIYTMMQDQSLDVENQGFLASAASLEDPLARLERHHTALKDLLSAVIVPRMADRISLRTHTN